MVEESWQEIVVYGWFFMLGRTMSWRLVTFGPRWLCIGLCVGNAYAQIIRDSSGDLVSLWPLSPDQTEVFVDSKGQVAYKYQKDGKTYILGVNDVLHIKDIGNGLIGLSKLSFMSSSVKEATDTQKFATANAENYGKPSGILTVDHILKKENKNGVNERERIRQSLYGIRTGGSSKIVIRWITRGTGDLRFVSPLGIIYPLILMTFCYS